MPERPREAVDPHDDKGVARPEAAKQGPELGARAIRTRAGLLNDLGAAGSEEGRALGREILPSC